jgi:arsenate reductase
MSHDSTVTDPTRIAFMCVRNAGRSQMSTAFAERERRRRGLQDRIEILTGGTDPADAVHGVVIEAMDEVGIDLSDRTPRAITEDELRSCDVVATMGCSTLDVGTVGDDIDVRDWALTDPGEQDLDDVRAIRDDIEERVVALFDELGAA